MARFQILPIELKFFEWFNKSADNVLEASRLFYALLSDYRNVESRVAQLTELEHRGDFIVHEIFDLLRSSFITPLDPSEIRGIASAIDDVVDRIEAAGDALLIYKIDHCTPEAERLADIVHSCAEQIHSALPLLREKKRLPEVRERMIEVNRLENEADRVYRKLLSKLFSGSYDALTMVKLREVADGLEDAADALEHVAHAVESIAVKES